MALNDDTVTLTVPAQAYTGTVGIQNQDNAVIIQYTFSPPFVDGTNEGIDVHPGESHSWPLSDIQARVKPNSCQDDAQAMILFEV